MNAQLLSPREYDTLVAKMREFFLSIDPESAAARTRTFVGLMGARPTLPSNVNEVTGPAVGGEVGQPGAIENVPESEAASRAPDPSSRPEGRAAESLTSDDVYKTAAEGPATPGSESSPGSEKRQEVGAALKVLERMRSAADRSIAGTVRRGVDRGSSVYGENFLDELLDLRAKTTHVGIGFLSALDAALAQIAVRPGIVLAEEVLSVVTALRTALTSGGGNS